MYHLRIGHNSVDAILFYKDSLTLLNIHSNIYSAIQTAQGQRKGHRGHGTYSQAKPATKCPLPLRGLHSVGSGSMGESPRLPSRPGLRDDHTVLLCLWNPDSFPGGVFPNPSTSSAVQASTCFNTLTAIERNSWLGDEHIEAANCLLRNQFPNQAGFRHPVLGQSRASSNWTYSIKNKGGDPHWKLYNIYFYYISLITFVLGTQ